MENGKEFYFKVNLKKGLTQSLSGVTGKSLATPSLEEVVNKDDFFTKLLLNNKVLALFRVILVLVFAFVAGTYLYWRGYFGRFF